MYLLSLVQEAIEEPLQQRHGTPPGRRWYCALSQVVCGGLCCISSETVLHELTLGEQCPPSHCSPVVCCISFSCSVVDDDEDEEGGSQAPAAAAAAVAGAGSSKAGGKGKSQQGTLDLFLKPSAAAVSAELVPAMLCCILFGVEHWQIDRWVVTGCPGSSAP